MNYKKLLAILLPVIYAFVLAAILLDYLKDFVFLWLVIFYLVTLVISFSGYRIYRNKWTKFYRYTLVASISFLIFTIASIIKTNILLVNYVRLFILLVSLLFFVVFSIRAIIRRL